MLNDLLNNLQRDGAITEASLRGFAEILSGPVAFVTSRASSTDWTSLTVSFNSERLVHWKRFQMKEEGDGGCRRGGGGGGCQLFFNLQSGILVERTPSGTPD